MTIESNNGKIYINNKGKGGQQVHCDFRRLRGDIYMLQDCKCGQKKQMTQVDGRFAYQVCGACNSVLNVIYLGPKEETEEMKDEDSFLGI